MMTLMTGVLLKALYEYTALEEEELSFPEGAVIELVNKSVSGVDDGWWQGRYGGKTGMFPAVVVEEQSSATVSHSL